MKKLLVLILAINLIQTGFCQTGGLFTKESLIEMKNASCRNWVTKRSMCITILRMSCY